MAVLINCLILCVCQFNSVRPTGLNLPFTSISYKASPINPRSLSLSFSTNDSIDSKKTKNLEDFKPIKTSLSTQDEELTKMSMSKLIGLISDNDSTPINYIFTKQKQNDDPKILYKVASPPQQYVPNLRTNINERYDLPKDLQNKKNAVNYNIKVISPPAVFYNIPIYLPVAQSVEDSKTLSETNKYSKNVPPTFLLPYPVRTLTEEDKQKSTEWHNVRKTFSNYEVGTKYRIVEPLIQRNTINIAEHDVHLIQKMAKPDDIIVPPKATAKCTYDLNINNTPLCADSQSNNLLDYNYHQIPPKYLDTSYIQYHDIIPTMSDIIDINQEIKPTVDTLSTHATDFLTKPLFPNFPEFSKPQPIYTRDLDTYNKQLGTSLDNIVSFFKSKFILAISDNSTTNSLKTPPLLTAPELLQHITDGSVKKSEKPVLVPTSPEVESPPYLLKPNLDILQKVTDNATKKSIAKSPVPYISSVTINYMPCMESSNEIMIFV